MSETATHPAAVPYAPALPESGRPTSVTVLASIGIVIGALFLLCKPAGLFFQLFMPMPQPNPMVDAVRNDPTLRWFTLGHGITGTLISLLLLMSSLGSLALKPWARTGMLGYAFLAIMMTLIGNAVSAVYIGPEMERAMQQSGMPQPPGVAWMKGWMGVVIGLVIGLWYPVLILVYYTRSSARRAFEEGLARKDI